MHRIVERRSNPQRSSSYAPWGLRRKLRLHCQKPAHNDTRGFAAYYRTIIGMNSLAGEGVVVGVGVGVGEGVLVGVTVGVGVGGSGRA